MKFFPITVNRIGQYHQDQISPIFTGEDPRVKKPKNKKHFLNNNNNYRSNISFKDNYFEKNPKFTQKKIDHIIGQKAKQNTKNPYTDEFYISPYKKEILQRKLVSHNEIKEFIKKENGKYNKVLMDKNKKK